MKKYEAEYIERIKNMLNIGKKKQTDKTSLSRVSSLPPIKFHSNQKNKKKEQKKLKSNKNKFVDKIILNLKLKSEFHSYPLSPIF